MPRAFLVVKQKEGSTQQQTFQPSSSRHSDLDHTSGIDYQAALQSRPSLVQDLHLQSSGDEMRPSPTSSPESYEPRSSPEPFHPEKRPSLGDHYNFVQTTGASFAQIDGVFDMSQKKPRLDAMATDPLHHLSPKSTTSDSAASDVSSSPGPADHHRYLLPRPRNQHPSDRRSPLESFHEHPRDMVEPLSPLHRLVSRSSPEKNALPGFSQGMFGLPLPPMGMAFPGMAHGMPAHPMFLPHHFRPYPSMAQVNTAMGAFRPREQAEEPMKTDEVIKEEKPSPRQRTSHSIEDLLARSPPKAQKPVVPVPVNVHQHRPVPIVQSSDDDESVKSSDDIKYASPMQRLVEMDQKLAQSPSSHSFPAAYKSPKAVSTYATDIKTNDTEQRNRSIQRNLELSFQRQGVQHNAFPSIETLLPEAMRQRQQLAQNYHEKLLHLQRTHEKMQALHVPNNEKAPESKDRRSFEFVPDINKNHCINDVHEFARESIFPKRFGDEEKDIHMHERLSPGLLENVPVDFTHKPINRKPGPPRFQCDGCKKSYSTLNGLSKHKEFHCVSHVKKEFSCKHCNKTYTSLGALKMHIRTHTLPCKCQICGKAFSRPWLLQGHIRTHTGEKPFSCQHCNRSFADRSNLRAHLQTHTDVKRYSCQTCTKTFSRMSLLTKHKENGCVGMH